MSLRAGDKRPFRRPHADSLRLTPTGPIRWLPRHGQPFCIVEFLSQHSVRLAAYLPFYAAVVVTLTLLVVFILGWP